jgi:hypothetical protein
LYQFHGVDLAWQPGASQAVGVCPFCERSGKFYVAAETGVWSCKVCGSGSSKGGGNVYTFIRMLLEASLEETTKADYEELAVDRRLSPEALRTWSVAKSSLTGDWLVPGHNTRGALVQLYRYSAKRLLASPGLTHQLCGIPLLNPKATTVYVCEGVWDAIAMWQALGSVKFSEETNGFLPTGSPSSSLLSECSVLAVPGCNSYRDSWTEALSGKETVFLYDNDYPRKNGKKTQDPVGMAGMRRAIGLASKWDHPPASLSYLCWGKDGHTTEHPDGFDVRDLLTAPGQNTVKSLDYLHSLIQPAPVEWLDSTYATHVDADGANQALECKDWKTVHNAWREAVKMTEGLDRGLAIMFAVSLSTMQIEDQLWFRIIGPPSSGKSTFCDGLGVSRDYVVLKSFIKGFHSGFKQDNSGKDYGLIPELKNKTYVIKDADSLLTEGNRQAIMAQLRDIYDGSTSSHYRNGSAFTYDGIRISIVLCGTDSLRHIDSSELGARFLDCIVMEEIDEELEQEILERISHRVKRNIAKQMDGKFETRHEEDKAQAMRLTGGYINYLRENANELLGAVGISEAAMEQCRYYGKFISFLRARPSDRQTETDTQREMAGRLVSQLTKLALCLAVVLNKSEVDEEVLSIVRRVTMDTSKGRTRDQVKVLYQNIAGLTTDGVAHETNKTPTEERKLLKFLRSIKALDLVERLKPDGKHRSVWILTPSFRRLCDKVKLLDN